MIPSKQYNFNKKKSLIQPYLAILGCYFLMNAKLGCKSGQRASVSSAVQKVKEGYKKVANKAATNLKSSTKLREQVQRDLNQGEHGFKDTYMDTLNTAAKMNDSNYIVQAIAKIDSNSQITKEKVNRDILLKGEYFINVIRLGGNPMKKWLSSDKIAKNPLVNKKGEHLLHKASRDAIIYDRYKEYVDALDVNDFFLTTDKGYTPLHILAKRKSCRKLEYLVELALKRDEQGVFTKLCKALSDKVSDQNRSVLGFLVLEKNAVGRLKLKSKKAMGGDTNGINGLKVILASLTSKKSLDASAYDDVLITLENDIDDQIRKHTTDKDGGDATGRGKENLKKYYGSLKDIIAEARSGNVSDFANLEIEDDEEDEEE